ncbi:MAG TPA: VCBS repeat-containing protein [Nannocystaceae bacterium]|nr:VCBS repeat-containing protein [Nannocystaceae bacterium]
MNRRVVVLLLPVLAACAPVVATPADDNSSEGGTSGVSSLSMTSADPLTSAGGSQVDGDPPPDDDDDDDGSTTESMPPPCSDAPPPALTVHTLDGIGNRAGDVNIVDVDGDAHAELLITDPDLGAVWMFDGAAPLDGATPTVIPANGPAQALASGDLDGDGAIDLAIAHADGRVEAQLGDGAGAFVSQPGVEVTHELYDIELGDLDGDGVLDVVVLGHSDAEGRVWWLRGLGDAALAPAEILAPGDWPRAYSHGLAVIADASRPNAAAVVAQLFDNDQLWIAVLRPGVAAQIVAEIPYSATDVRVGRFDGDATDDIVALGTESSEIWRWVALADNEYDAMTTSTGGRGIGVMMAVGDLDGVGATDLVVGYGLEPPLERVLSSCDGELVREQLDVELMSGNLHAIATGDLDSDDIDDIVVLDGGFGEQHVTVLLTAER